MTTKEYKAAYYVANREEILARSAAYRAGNVEKIKAGHAAYNAAHKEERKVQKRAYYAANPEKLGALRAQRRRKNYGVSPEGFQLMLSAQKNACAICAEGFSKAPNVDHDHETGGVRGLLCMSCNTGLGKFKDSVERLQKAISYLQKSSE